MTDIVTVPSRALLPAPVDQLNELADFMAKSGPMVPPTFQNHPERCRAIAYQSARWGLDPFAVAQKAYVTKDKSGAERIAYEAQLVAALVLARAPLDDAPEYTYRGQGGTRQCKVAVRIRGDERPKEYETPTVAQIKIKNSPNWYSDVDQQLGYFAIRAWARRHAPDVLLGVYTNDELEPVRTEVVDSTPIARAAALFDDSDNSESPATGEQDAFPGDQATSAEFADPLEWFAHASAEVLEAQTVQRLEELNAEWVKAGRFDALEAASASDCADLIELMRDQHKALSSGRGGGGANNVPAEAA